MSILCESENSGSELQLVSFKLGNEEFAVDILKIQEINRMSEITKMPDSPDFVEGVINLRGKVIPIIDLKKRFEFAETKISRNSRIVVMNVREKIVGFIVDSVSEVLRLPSSTVEPPPPMIGGVDEEYIRGVGKLEDRLLILLDIDEVLSRAEVAILSGSLQEKTQTARSERKEEPSVSKKKVMEYRGMKGTVEVEKEINTAIDDVSGKVEITKEDLYKLVSHVKGILEGNLVEEELELYGHLGELAKYINETKKSLQNFDATQIADEYLPEASDQLESIVASTEEATNKILGDTEEMLENQNRIARALEFVRAIELDEGTESVENRDLAISELETASAINNEKLMDIMSACNFQDLTGQRIQKIIALVKGVESKVMKMILSFNIKRHEKSGGGDLKIVDKEKDLLARIEGSALKGPAKEGEGVNQAEVDDLLNDLFG